MTTCASCYCAFFTISARTSRGLRMVKQTRLRLGVRALGRLGETPEDVTRAKPVDVTLPTPAVEDERSHFDRCWRRR